MTHLRWLFPVISCKHKLWAQSWISSIGSGLGLSRLYSTGSRLPVFVSSSTRSSTLQMPSFPANTCTARSKRTSLHVSCSPESTHTRATLYPARSNSSPPMPARYESTHIDAGRRCSVAGRKRESGAYSELPFGFRLKIRPFL